ncbi:MAG: hypothetical protein AABN34_22210 [Acidobacteriota bacterium]
MNVNELAVVAQGLPVEQQKELIKALFKQLPKSEEPVAAIVQIGDLEAGTQEMREKVNESIQHSAKELHEREAEP